LGVSVSAINPAQIPFWFIWTTQLINTGILKTTFLDFNLFTAGAAVGSVAGLALYIYGGKWSLPNESQQQAAEYFYGHCVYPCCFVSIVYNSFQRSNDTSLIHLLVNYHLQGQWLERLINKVIRLGESRYLSFTKVIKLLRINLITLVIMINATRAKPYYLIKQVNKIFPRCGLEQTFIKDSKFCSSGHFLFKIFFPINLLQALYI
jgi:hypothetical protein